MCDELRDDEVRALYLGGTVPVPSPFPETGLITLCKDAIRPGLEIRHGAQRHAHHLGQTDHHADVFGGRGFCRLSGRKW